MPELASIKFLIFEDNGGDYHWRILAHDGAPLAQSVSFASYDDAEQAAQRVSKAAASARFERDAVGAGPVDLIARRDAKSDDSDAERWLDEGGSVSAMAPAPRR
ncbi:MAG: YegP family protein [Solirubrobacteraceae bacterium]